MPLKVVLDGELLVQIEAADTKALIRTSASVLHDSFHYTTGLDLIQSAAQVHAIRHVFETGPPWGPV